ncbi:phosphotransferase [Blautia sp. CLA-JM-H16]|uniref:Phosphotransferase n=1 Tax=Blautia aquisgranensis TaxID=3133153 RepID=A0ABV1BAP9_9FIRM
MSCISEEKIRKIAGQFDFTGELVSWSPCGSGHINGTWLLRYRIGNMGSIKVILQKINLEIFQNPDELMENISGVTEHLKKKIIENDGDPEREVLNLIPTKEGKNYLQDADGECWRAYIFITDAVSYDLVEKPEDFYESAVAFGRFQEMLADYPAETLHETIKGFHDTKKRFQTLKKAVECDSFRRAEKVQDEIDFAMQHEELAGIFGEFLQKGEIPLRVTHNDTKLNNVMIDIFTGKGICVVDLDTVMPGLAMDDFGDAIRFGASTALEDEKDLSKVSCDMGLYEIYVKGFLESCGDKLTPKEIELLPMGAKVMTYECGIRFLTDYLEGDHYFKTDWEGQNLDRCRTQFKLLSDMEKKWDIMQEIVNRYKPE